MNRKTGVTLVIPCLNEEKCIVPTIRWAQQVYREHALEGEILVVDNGCRDKTAELAREMGAQVVNAPRTGYGEALRAGFQNARFEYVVMCDADMSYPLSEMPRLLEPLKDGADIVIGNRLRGDIEPGAMPFLNRYLGTPVLSWLIRRLHRVPAYDCNSGFRAIRKSGLERMKLKSRGMELASEMIIRSGALKLIYKEIEIPFYRDQRGARSHLNRWRDGMRHLRVISKEMISYLR
jgi:glycosyltransferase involved in cell wall biosynthesis